MKNENYRVKDKENINYRGHKTCFKFFIKKRDVFVYESHFFIDGWNRSDDECIAYALRILAEEFG